MTRFAIIIDRAGDRDLEAAVGTCCEVMTRGGSHEQRSTIVRPPFAALALAHAPGSPFVEHGPGPGVGTGPGRGGGHAAGVVTLPIGMTPRGVEADVESPMAAPTTSPTAAPTAAPEEAPRSSPAAGPRCLVRWDAGTRQLVVASEPHGQIPIFYLHRPDLTIVASEVKAIWALERARLEVDADGVADLMTLGYCLGDRTLWRQVRCVPPGVHLTLGDGTHGLRTVVRPRFSDARRVALEPVIEELNRALVDILELQHRQAGDATIALSGGMDSRYVLAAARRVWPGLDSFTFGHPGGVDLPLGAELARRAGIPNRAHLIPEDYLSRWAPFAVWRTDGLVSCVRAYGLDVCVLEAQRTHHVLNGIGGDFLLGGAFVRPRHLARRAGAGELARTVLAIQRLRRAGQDGLAEVFKPELAAQRATPAVAVLEELFRQYGHARMGNDLLCYWLRHYCARSTAMGLVLEAPFLSHIGPLVDPAFIEAAAALPLEQRFMARGLRRALQRLAPEFMAVPWPRYGLAPRAPWPLLALGRLGLRWGLWGDRQSFLARPHLPWMRGVLLERDTFEHGFFLPTYIMQLIESYEAGAAGSENELGMVLSIELWRRIFVEGETGIAEPPALA